MEGATFESVLLRRPDLRFPFPANFEGRVAGSVVGQVSRRGKYLIVSLSTGETLIMHLGMTGRFLIRSLNESHSPGRFHYAPASHSAHDHVEFVMSGPQGRFHIGYNDVRRFGFMDLAATKNLEESKHLKGMGPEPLDPAFTPEVLLSALATRTAPMKAVLLDQSVIAGLGNIYVCEALFRARVSPLGKASRINAERGARLHAAISEVLLDAIGAGGSTLRDFAGSDGSLGYFQHSFNVYGREGEPCPNCRSTVRRIVQAGRSTFYCSKCQR